MGDMNEYMDVRRMPETAGCNRSRTDQGDWMTIYSLYECFCSVAVLYWMTSVRSGRRAFPRSTSPAEAWPDQNSPQTHFLDTQFVIFISIDQWETTPDPHQPMPWLQKLVAALPLASITRHWNTGIRRRLLLLLQHHKTSVLGFAACLHKSWGFVKRDTQRAHCCWVLRERRRWRHRGWYCWGCLCVDV